MNESRTFPLSFVNTITTPTTITLRICTINRACMNWGPLRDGKQSKQLKKKQNKFASLFQGNQRQKKSTITSQSLTVKHRKWDRKGCECVAPRFNIRKNKIQLKKRRLSIQNAIISPGPYSPPTHPSPDLCSSGGAHSDRILACVCSSEARCTSSQQPGGVHPGNYLTSPRRSV